MATRVYHINKRTGVTYVYESVSYWDKEKKQPRNKQVCIGKLDPATKELIVSKRLTPGHAIKTTTLSSNEALAHTKTIPVALEPAVTATTEIVGPLLVLESIHTRLGLDDILKTCFPKTHILIKMMAYYLVCEGSPLSHCESWCKSHAPALAPKLNSQRISEILSTLNFDTKQTFCKQWIKKVLETDYLCYDITSISSYSESNEYIKYGYNRDKEQLPQLNLAILFGQNNRLPVYYQRTPGNITDVTTLPHLVKTFKALGVLNPSYIMDKGFYSKKNIDALLLANHKFMVSVPLNNAWIKQAIDAVASTIHSPEGYQKIDQEILYVHTQLHPWGDKKKRCYLHLYYNAFAHAKAVDKFNAELLLYKKELEDNTPHTAHQKAYDDFFIIRTTPKRGRVVSYNNDSVRKHIKTYCGFQAIFCNNVKDPIEALKIYRDKDVVEKSFDDLKNSLDMKRLRMHTSPTVDVKLFIQFLALIYKSALRKEMRTSKLIETYTTRELLKEMDTLTKIKYNKKHAPLLTEITKNQKDIFKRLGIEEPNHT